MDVYEREGKPDDIPKGAKYMGCFADDNQDRALTLKNDSNSKMNYAVRMEDVSILGADFSEKQNRCIVLGPTYYYSG